MIAVSIHRTDPDLGEAAVYAGPDGADRLRPLLAAAATTDLDDHEAWTAILRSAHQVTAELLAHGGLPAHLTVCQDDTPVLATRMIAAAWKHVTGSPERVVRR